MKKRRERKDYRVAPGVVFGLVSSFLLLSTIAAQQPDGGVERSLSDDPPVLPETFVPGVRPAFDPARGAGSLFGGPGGAMDAAGSGSLIDLEALHRQSYDSPSRVLSQVPGVYLREEDGFGNFPNISLRGVDMARSAKVTIMEDGILAAPAPYSAPSAYYFPTVGRMYGVEVFKGSSQVQFGPHSTGGAINFLSTPIPDRQASYMRTLFGTNNEMRVHAWTGNTWLTESGERVGYLLEGYFRETDGFKTIDQAGNFPVQNATDTGFINREPMVKVFWEPNTLTYQRFEAKWGYTAMNVNEGYVGLTEDDFAANPLRRYSGTRFDHMANTAARSYLRHTLGDPEVDWLTFTQTVYYTKFNRDWFKLATVIDGATTFSLPAILGDPITNSIGYGILTGQQAGTLRLRHNNRSYSAYGYDAVANMAIEGENADHDISVGFRYHRDRVRRFQQDDDYLLSGNGAVESITEGSPGAAGDRRQVTQAIAVYLQDRMDFGRLAVTPGIRFESLDVRYQRFPGELKSVFDRTDSMTMVSGGVGMTYDVDDDVQLLGGFHRGFSPPSPSKITSGMREEESLASEAGIRVKDDEQHWAAQILGFYTHFNDLIVLDNVGSGAEEENDEQVGEVYATGIEAMFQFDMGKRRDWKFSSPWFVSMTYTDAKLLSDTLSHDAESIFAGGLAGAAMPYIPEFVMMVGIGAHFEDMGIDLTGIYADQTFSTASNEVFNGGPDADIRFGTTDDYFLWDLSAYKQLNQNWRIFGGVQNLFDRRYVTTRHPFGPRSGAPLFGYLGVEATY
ncbi:MAG: TonB-dependent receptor [Planctomycetota bacterium]|nr:TonB-dependent receptor [Planctomycetota bacterium]